MFGALLGAASNQTFLKSVPSCFCLRAYFACRCFAVLSALPVCCLIDAASNQRLQQQEEEAPQPDSADGDPSWKNCWQKADNKWQETPEEAARGSCVVARHVVVLFVAIFGCVLYLSQPHSISFPFCSLACHWTNQSAASGKVHQL